MPKRGGLAHRARRVGVAAALVVALAVSGFAGTAAAAGPTLVVTFLANGSITVALPDGTPVGTPNGAPTTIPAGYYTVLLQGPGGCVMLPYFQLTGPGISVMNDLQDGEVQSTGFVANFLPGSTYTWRNQGVTPPVVYTFVTSADIGASTPPVIPSAAPTGGKGSVTVSSADVVGSGSLPFRGALTGSVSRSGKVTLLFKGKPVTTLPAGRYAVTITDRSARSGFTLRSAKRAAMTIAGIRTVGKDKATVSLTDGQWSFSPGGSGHKSFFVVAG